MKLRQWVGVVMVTVCLTGIVFLWVSRSLSAAPPAADPTPVSPIVTAPSSSQPTQADVTASPVSPKIPKEPPSEAVNLRIPGVLFARFGGAIIPNQDNVLVPPSSTEVFRWAERGKPGCTSRDSVFLLGHTVRAGGGVFDDLQEVRPGQLIVVETETGIVRYEVTDTALYDKDTIDDVDDIYERVPGRLVLVGCFLNPDGSVQTKNFVVTARATGC